ADIVARRRLAFGGAVEIVEGGVWQTPARQGAQIGDIDDMGTGELRHTPLMPGRRLSAKSSLPFMPQKPARQGAARAFSPGASTFAGLAFDLVAGVGADDLAGTGHDVAVLCPRESHIGIGESHMGTALAVPVAQIGFFWGFAHRFLRGNVLGGNVSPRLSLPALSSHPEPRSRRRYRPAAGRGPGRAAACDSHSGNGAPWRARPASRSPLWWARPE